FYIYVSQPPGFLDPKYPEKVYKVVKALFMGCLKLLEHVQVYVDDIIFGSTKKSWCDEFEALIKSRFQMSSIGRAHFLSWPTSQTETKCTPIETQKPLVKDEEASDVDVVIPKA
ncbi:hypothetical protein Tco_0203296, partial [Tanacetum coccineum]